MTKREKAAYNEAVAAQTAAEIAHEQRRQAAAVAPAKFMSDPRNRNLVREFLEQERNAAK